MRPSPLHLLLLAACVRPSVEPPRAQPAEAPPQQRPPRFGCDTPGPKFRVTDDNIILDQIGDPMPSFVTGPGRSARGVAGREAVRPRLCTPAGPSAAASEDGDCVYLGWRNIVPLRGEMAAGHGVQAGPSSWAPMSGGPLRGAPRASVGGVGSEPASLAGLPGSNAWTNVPSMVVSGPTTGSACSA